MLTTMELTCKLKGKKTETDRGELSADGFTLRGSEITLRHSFCRRGRRQT